MTIQQSNYVFVRALEEFGNHLIKMALDLDNAPMQFDLKKAQELDRIAGKFKLSTEKYLRTNTRRL